MALPFEGGQVSGDGTYADGADVTPIQLRDHCRDHLAGFKVPRDIVFDRDLPKGPTGKILKRRLREQLAAST